MGTITLTTDFGLSDWFVGTIKGVIAKISPRARVLDITHGIAQGDIRAGAIALSAAYRFFPRNTIHVAVVDPGVGSSRAAIAVRTKDFYFVGPDNGVLSLALAQEKVGSIHRLEKKKFLLPARSRTFHGRDIFAPVAAHLNEGVPLKSIGPRTVEYERLLLPSPSKHGQQVHGEIIYIDAFGNAMTNITTKHLGNRGSPKGRVNLVSAKQFCPLVEFYEAVPRGRLLALINSAGLLEIAVNGGNAARLFRLAIGQKVSVKLG